MKIAVAGVKEMAKLCGATPCAVCGSRSAWKDADGPTHCMKCEPHGGEYVPRRSYLWLDPPRGVN
jgi:hypothetical protein